MGIVNDIAKKELNIDVGYSTDQYDYHLTLPPIDINLSCFGRENDIEKILRRLEKEKLLIVVNGIGGIGKTRLCKYIYRAAEKQTTPIKFDHIAWLNYSNNLMDSFIHAFPPDWIPSTNATREEKYRYILRKINSLAEKKNVLLIIDNVDRLPSSDLKLGTLTQLRCYVIVTSRLKVMEKNIYSLGLLVPSAAEELFLWYYTYDYAGRDHEISDILPALLNLCGFHAMTIELMAKSFNT
ncbi:ATP-binding protein, partial [Mediterraneibacter glycyrrhizinilyticus]